MDIIANQVLMDPPTPPAVYILPGGVHQNMVCNQDDAWHQNGATGVAKVPHRSLKGAKKEPRSATKEGNKEHIKNKWIQTD
jgi:hypothetical protein